MNQQQNYTIGFPVRNRIKFANEAIECILNNCNYNVIIIDDNSDNPNGDYIKNDRIKIIYNKEKKGLTALWNQITKESETERIILSGDKLRPEKNDFDRIDNYLNQNYAIVATYMIGFFGFSKYLTTKIGFFDEGYTKSGFEDTDLLNELYANNLGIYFSLETPYIQIGSGWSSNSENKSYYDSKWKEDWVNHKLIQLKPTMPSEEYIGKCPEVNYLTWDKSIIKSDNHKNYFNNLKYNHE